MSELEDELREVLKEELRMSERVENIGEQYTNEEIEDEMENVLEDVLQNVEDPTRLKKIYMLTVQFGKVFQSQKLVNYGKTKLQKWKEQYVE